MIGSKVSPAHGTAAATLQLRVTFADTWTTSTLSAKADESIASVKTRSLAASNIKPELNAGFEVKHGGIPVRDESRSLSSLGIKNGAALIILARRRRAVR